MDESSPFGAPGDGAGRAVRGGPAPRLHRLGAVPSTQDEAAARLRAGERPPFAVTATRQDAGRGRLGRAFASPEGESLALTYVHRTALDPARRGWFPLAAGLAAVRALDRVVPAAGQKRGTPVGLKWPNDLHTPDGRKLGGILAEARGQDALLLGIGVNLHGPVRSADGAAVPGAAWLRGPGGLRPGAEPADGAPLREALEEALVDALAEELAALESAQGDGGAAGTRDRYTMTCLTLGCAVRVDPLGGAAGGGDAASALRGTARGIDGHGRLVLDLVEGGGMVAVDVGDVRHLRPDAPPSGGQAASVRHGAHQEQESSMEKRGPAR
ncbi:MAG TPA: biotin--[acetyl-CoA-carboxylase] ligase [Candidatus Brachybacterium intestinipullorum]|uniref:Biotin--[acetyl-CoA-carboxylase] ligase n=1 Tax=Candidatus Brachybacterium intestinipullorum TaxID=2838512 RepID=A0A9D2THQ1_9MICO|nr:biotin--[acetyl-CoA-carboxylase] ligase [Candidatus Brachybacterium intestinipullorum]